MFEYLNDMEFLMKLDKLNMRTQYAKIVLLSFDEKPIREIQGNITSGNLTVNGSSAVRRTVTLTMLANEENSNITNLDNEISLDKKFKLFIGYKNPLKSYQHYGDVIWFPCGIFIITSASVSRGTSGWTIAINGKDKMCLLDGTVGGTLPQSITFHEREIHEVNGDIIIEQPTIFQIIYEAVNHWGGELIENIIISDIDNKTKLLVRYKGDRPIYFSSNYESFDFQESKDFHNMYTYGQDTGYQETDFTYPGELILKAGDTVVTLLDKIKDTLGNFEYFYDIDGRFIFQEIKNYLNTGSPLTELTADDYVKSYNNAKFLYSLTDLDTTTSININPKYSDVKNDFYAWGCRQTSSGADVNIRYHLAIDTKPDLVLAKQYMYEVKDKETGIIIIYTVSDYPNYTYPNPAYEATCVGGPCDEWREELYRRALVAQVTSSVDNNYYDSELIAEWRGLYDPLNKDWDATNHWNPEVFNNPSGLNYWLDFIDTSSEIGKYSINKIGRRTKVVNDKDIKSIYNNEVPDVVFIKGLQTDKIAEYTGIGQKYFVLTDEYYDMFQVSSTWISCFDKIREMMYQNLSYNTTITITCLPKYYMEPNNIIYIEDKKSNISGNYQITQLSLPLSYSGTMRITATEVLTRV